MSSEKDKKEPEIYEPGKEEGIQINFTRSLPWKGIRPGWDPVLGLETIRNTMAELISDIFFQPGKAPFELPWQPTVDMYLSDGKLVVDLSLPGCNKSNIQIHATSDLIIVRGDSPGPVVEKEENFFIRERKTGKFSRSIPLPFEVIPERIKAQFQDGLLNLSVPVKTGNPPGSIKIEIE